MAAKKTTAKKNGAAKGTAVAEVEQLPKGQLHAKDGTIILKPGEHKGLADADYQVHNEKVRLKGDVFIADFDVTWLPVKNCVCKKERPAAVKIEKLPTGRFVAFGKCENSKCSYHKLTYVWVLERGRLDIG